MTWIKPLLMLPLLGILWYVVLRSKQRSLYRLTILLLGCLGLLLVWKPELSQRLADFLGVGRGTDLVLYLSTVTLITAGVMLYSRIRKLEEQQTQLIRKISLLEANQPPHEHH
jgi:hypothetical protein